MRKCRILNIDIADIHESTLLEQLNKGILFTPNIDHLVKLQTDLEFYNAYMQANFVVCDSKVLKLFSWFLANNKIRNVIAGSSFFPSFYNYHKDNQNIKIFLLGAASGVALKAQERINKKVGREIIVDTHSPSYGFEKSETECANIIELINQSKATVLVVGLGAPKQEKWIVKYKDQLTNVDIILALGATIDFEAGKINRAPMVIRKLALEWLYRILQEPKRLWRRYLIEDIRFFFLFFKQVIHVYKNPFG
jgi:N-acetylglucosaminyldiphosphoundecaprenol N-acetyl-beta-D-mannosaminyltransferase